MAQITSWPQEGVCDVCKKKTLVRVVIDNNKGFYVCSECANGKIGNICVNDLVKKYGKRVKR